MLQRHKLKYMMVGVLYVKQLEVTVILYFVNIYHLTGDSSNLNLDFPSFYFHKCILNQLNQISNHQKVNPTPVFWQYYDTRQDFSQIRSSQDLDLNRLLATTLTSYLILNVACNGYKNSYDKFIERECAFYDNPDNIVIKSFTDWL